jgi:hypothetical protein
MAETTPTVPAAATSRRKTAATNRSTAAKKAAATRARKRTAQTARQTTTATRARAARREITPVDRYVDLAGKVVTIQVGAALVARDSAGQLAKKYSSIDAVERELKARGRRVETNLRTFERRGAKARTQIERDLRARRARVENDLRALRTARRDVGAQANLVGARVENLVQSGITAGTQAAAKVTERVARFV